MENPSLTFFSIIWTSPEENRVPRSQRLLKKEANHLILFTEIKMHNTRQISPRLHYVGNSDRRLALFENVYPLPDGVSYNSYLITDDKTILLDCTDQAVSRQFFENIGYLLQDRPLDYLVIHHMEPDHSATVEELLLRYPDVTILGTARTRQMMHQFFHLESEPSFIEVKDGDTLETENHCLNFITAPMVHWPEVMVSYDSTDKTLFSADAFGTFGALTGNIFADEFDFNHQMLDEARRYYFNIVGKYGAQVQLLLKKAAALEVNLLCPLHGPVWRQGIGEIVNLYNTWSSYTPELNSVLVIYGSIYGNTQNAAEILSGELAILGVRNMGMYDASKTDVSILLSECFKYHTIVFASSSYNAGLFSPMEHLLLELKAHNFQNRHVALVQNGSWAPSSMRCMKEILSQMKNLTILEEVADLRSSVGENNLTELKALAKALSETLK